MFLTRWFFLCQADFKPEEFKQSEKSYAMLALRISKDSKSCQVSGSRIDTFGLMLNKK
jgi:hypothetical protein